MALVAAGILAPVCAQQLSPTDVDLRENAVEAARAGDYTASLEVLRDLVATYPTDLDVKHDLVTVLAWSEDDQAAVELAAPLQPGVAPRYTQLAVAKSARNLARFDLAARWYDAVLDDSPSDPDALIGRLLTAADAGNATDTVTFLGGLESLAGEAGGELSASDALSVALARGYALRSLGDLMAALVAYNDVLETWPDETEALRGKALVLRALLMPDQALALAESNEGILTLEEIERLHADAAAIRLRLATRTPYVDSDRYAIAESVIALIDAELASATTPAARQALQLDRVVALSDSGNAVAATRQYQDLLEYTVPDQPYVLAAAARSYLLLEQPETALELLDHALSLDPAHLESRFQRVYALLDLDRYEEAFTATDALNSELPMTNRSPGDIVVKPNAPRLRAETLGGIAEAYGDQLGTAQVRFESLLDAAPNNSEWRQELANVYRWRGWRDRSLQEYRQVIAADAELLSARVGLAHTEMDARLYPQVEFAVSDMVSGNERDTAVQRLAERWQVHNQRELVVAAQTGDSSGPVSGTNNYAVDIRYYTAPIAYRYRVFVATHDGYAEFSEGESRRRRIGTGIEYRAPSVTATGLVSASRSGGDTGFSGTVDYRLNDYWAVGGGIDIDGDNVQLRAHRLGIDANRAYVRTRYAPHELASISIGFERAEYSDENVLSTAFIDGRYRFINGPRSKFDLVAGVARGRADTSAVPYFSPLSDTTTSVGVEHRMRIWRRYDRVLSHTASARAGRYAQQGFASDSIWALAYRIDWVLGIRHALGFEARRQGQLFDGVREHTTVAVITLTSRF